MASFDIAEWDPTTLGPAFTVICGRRMVGKTVLALNLLSRQSYGSNGIVFDPYNACHRNYSHMNVFDEYDSDTLDDILRRQAESPPSEREPMAVVLEEIDYFVLQSFNPALRTLMRAGSSLKALTLVTTQCWKDTAEVIRDNMDCAFISISGVTMKEKRAVYDELIMHSGLTFEQFSAIKLDPYEFLVWDQRAFTRTHDIKQSLFYYKAPSPKNGDNDSEQMASPA